MLSLNHFRLYSKVHSSPFSVTKPLQGFCHSAIQVLHTSCHLHKFRGCIYIYDNFVTSLTLLWWFISTVLDLDYYMLLHIKVFYLYINNGRILFLKPYVTSLYTFLVFITLASASIILLHSTTLTSLPFHFSILKSNCPQRLNLFHFLHYFHHKLPQTFLLVAHSSNNVYWTPLNFLPLKDHPVLLNIHS